MKTSPPTSVARRYTVKREIGRGGMGAVWLAVDEVLGREVAIKRVGMFPGGSSPDLLRAQREAKLAARLNHPHVVSVFDFVSDGDEQWLVMEYVDGTNLSVLAEQNGGLAPREAAAVIGQVAQALAAAHSAGIVHRDVKPSNILVTDAGVAKLADFGIARARADSTLTATGMVTGSPAYLAPEVASGHAATEASDVWSLGATLFHTLTGRPPYDVSDNVLAAMYRIVHDDPPRLADAGWPADLLDTTMAREPSHRWPMVRVQEHLASGPPEETEPLTPAGSATAVLPVVAPTSAEDLPAEDLSAAVAAPEPEQDPWPAYVDEEPALQPRADERRRNRGLMVLLGLAAAVAAVLVAWTLLQDDPSTSAGGPSASTASPSGDVSPTQGEPSEQSSPTPTTQAPNSGPGAGKATAMRSFVQEYVDTALTDPESSWQQLTTRFQENVGSYGSYAGFWNTIETATLRDVEADPDAMQVSYTITWDPKGDRGKEDERVVLGLVEDEGSYLIDYER